MSWFVVDDQAFQHPKHQALMRKGLGGDADALGAGYLWVLAGSRIKAALGDGVLDRWDLVQLVPDPERVWRMAALLVEVGLWHDSEHGCDRCEPVEPGQWRFHDWRDYYKRTGAEERLERALQRERKDGRLQAEVWERDRLPASLMDGPEGGCEALCAYCRQHLYRSTRKGRLKPEIEHVLPRPLGVNNLVISCAGCNRDKGRRSPKEAGLTLHLTQAHEEALAAHDARSHPQGSAGLRAAMLASDEGLLGQTADDDDQDSLPAPEGDAGPAPEPRSSHAQGPAEPGLEDDSSHPSCPTVSAGRPSPGPGSRTLTTSAGREAPGSGSPPEVSGEPPGCVAEPTLPEVSASASGSGAPTSGRQKTPVEAFNGWSLPFSGQGLASASGPAAPALAGPPQGVSVSARTGDGPVPDGRGPVLAAEHQRSASGGSEPAPAPAPEAPSRAGARGRTHGRTRAHARPPAPALPGARALAGQGRAPAGQGPAAGSRRRRRRGKRRGRGSPPVCREHGDRLPCRMCTYQEHHEETR